MDNLFIPNENDFRRWIREAIKDCFTDPAAKAELFARPPEEEPLLSRKEIAGIFRISLVTLHDWMNKGLPSYKQRGRVYFLRSEVMTYIMQNNRTAIVKAGI